MGEWWTLIIFVLHKLLWTPFNEGKHLGATFPNSCKHLKFNWHLGLLSSTNGSNKSSKIAGGGPSTYPSQANACRHFWVFSSPLFPIGSCQSLHGAFKCSPLTVWTASIGWANCAQARNKRQTHLNSTANFRVYQSVGRPSWKYCQPVASNWYRSPERDRRHPM